MNGLGNLFLGYDEGGTAAQQTGSHNLVLGEHQTFGSFAGLLAGRTNTLSGPYGVALGSGHTAIHSDAVVGTGFSRLAVRKQHLATSLPPGVQPVEPDLLQSWRGYDLGRVRGDTEHRCLERHLADRDVLGPGCARRLEVYVLERDCQHADTGRDDLCRLRFGIAPATGRVVPPTRMS